VLVRFIATAVARKRVADSWELAGPGLRQDVSYQEWRKGEIPVVPYPAAEHGQGAWDVVNYSYRNKVGLEVLLFPKPRFRLLGRDGRHRPRPSATAAGASTTG
jgi:hypothetical protein